MRRFIWQHKNVFVTAVLVVACGFIPMFTHSPYYLDLLITVIVNAVLAIAFLMMLRPGLVNLGLVAFWGVGAYTYAILVTKFHLSFWLGLPLSAVLTGVVALVIGIFLVGRGSGGLAFVVLSSVIGMVFPVAVGSIHYLGGYNGISNIPRPSPIHLPFLPAIAFDSKVQFFYLALFLFVIVMLITYAFYSSWSGRAWTAVGQGSRLAESIGIDPVRYRLLSVVVASVLLGLIGSFYASYEMFVMPDTFGMWTNIYVQIYAILGGLGYPILGPVTGSLVMTLLPQLTGTASTVAPIITGVILILLILFLPRGLLGLLEFRWEVNPAVVRMAKALFPRKRASKERGVNNHDT